MRPIARLAAAVLLPAALAVTGVTALPGSAGADAPADTGRQFSVLGPADASVAEVEAAVRAAGGVVERSNVAIGLVTARAERADFTARLARQTVLHLVAPTRPIGRVPDLVGEVLGATELSQSTGVGSRAAGDRPAAPVAPAGPGQRPVGPPGDPLDPQLWGLTAINAGQARQREAGDARVLVGILDTGVDGTHPDIAPNFSAELSRNFTTDLPTDPGGADLDGPCEVPSCVDPADRDDNGHGTHVAGTIAAAANGLGVTGIAPEVTIVNVRGAQDSGLFFLQPVVDAITYSADAGLDVVNMSFYVDPWAAICANNPADSPEQQAEQQLILEGMARAMAYAEEHGVTQVVAFGNSNHDPEALGLDVSSPNFPLDSAHPRLVDGSCKDLPAGDPHAVRVGAYGPSGAKSGFSNFGPSMTVSAPGGWYGDLAGTPQAGQRANGILSAYPRTVAEAREEIDEQGRLTERGRARGLELACAGGRCGLYQFAQGTSMAAPHAAGVAALIVSAYGSGTGAKFGLAPALVRRVLVDTAAARPCPEPLTALLTYQATCTGSPEHNSFYGSGSVDALAAVSLDPGRVTG